MKDKDFTRAVEVLDAALDMAKDKFGDNTAEACRCLSLHNICRLRLVSQCQG